MALECRCTCRWQAACLRAGWVPAGDSSPVIWAAPASPPATPGNALSGARGAPAELAPCFRQPRDGKDRRRQDGVAPARPAPPARFEGPGETPSRAPPWDALVSRWGHEGAGERGSEAAAGPSPWCRPLTPLAPPHVPECQPGRPLPPTGAARPGTPGTPAGSARPPSLAGAGGGVGGARGGGGTPVRRARGPGVALARPGDPPLRRGAPLPAPARPRARPPQARGAPLAPTPRPAPGRALTLLRRGPCHPDASPSRTRRDGLPRSDATAAPEVPLRARGLPGHVRSPGNGRALRRRRPGHAGSCSSASARGKGPERTTRRGHGCSSWRVRTSHSQRGGRRGSLGTGVCAGLDRIVPRRLRGRDLGWVGSAFQAEGTDCPANDRSREQGAERLSSPGKRSGLRRRMGPAGAS